MNKALILALGTLLLAASCATTPLTSTKDRPAITPARADLLEKLAKGTPLEQARARQLIPYEGAAMLDELLPLLDSADAVVSMNAHYAILDIANASTAPGRDCERKYVERKLAGLLGPGSTPAKKDLGLRILERVVSPGGDLSAIVAILNSNDPVFREKARAALLRIGTEPAKTALRAALKKNDPAFQAAILDGLAETRDTASAKVAAKLLAKGDAQVRVPALRVLAETGDPAYLPLFANAIKEGHPGTVCLLRYAQAMEGHADAEHARAVYIGLLAEPEAAAVEGALAGLARTGKPEDGEKVIALVNHAEIPVRHAAITAAACIPGDVMTAALARAYGQARPEEKPVFLAALATRNDEKLLAIFAAAAVDENDAMRAAALEAVGKMKAAGALEILVNAVPKAKGNDLDVIQEGLLRLARNNAAANNPALMAKAYQCLFAMSKDPDVRVTVVQGLAAYPSVAAFDLAMQAAADDTLKKYAADLLRGVAAACHVAGEAEKSQKALGALLSVDSSAKQLQAFADNVKALGGSIDLATLFTPIRKWQIVGPFKAQDLAVEWPNDLVNEKNPDLKATYTSADKTLAWKAIESGGEIGFVDLNGSLGPETSCYAYAYAEVTVPGRVQATLRMGSDDGVAAWVNGAKVYDHFLDRGLAPDSDIVQVRLEPGVNKILLKISQGQAGWGFCARLTDRDGRPLNFKQ